jgi:queuine tRNA-ribosyltransferase
MFELIEEDKKTNARLGILKTRRGKIDTPFFMPVATKATVKYISQSDLKSMGAKAVIANAFILFLKPGTDIIKKAGGIHKFMNFDKTIFTDCGGFQMLRKSLLEKPTNKGIQFKSPFNGKRYLISPEKIMQIEQDIGSDVAMMLDDVPCYGIKKESAVASLKRTHKWAKECIIAHKDKKQLLFGIAHGNFFKELRIKSAKFINKLSFDGTALGGLCIGEPKEKMYDMIKVSIHLLSKKKPRYIMGVGSPEDLIECVAHGIDIFDSVFPTQNARHDTLFTWKGKLRLDNARYKIDLKPIDKDCDCHVCKDYSRAYIKHLSNVNEALGKIYKTYHNLYFILRLMEKIREAIREDYFDKFRKEFLKGYKI